MKTFLTLFVLLFSSSVFGENHLPKCEFEKDEVVIQTPCYGTHISSEGDKYVGEWKNGLPYGKGTYTSPTGSIYEGEWENGLQHGQGTKN